MAAQLLVVWLFLYAGISRQAASVASRALKAILNHALARTPTSLPSSKRFNIDIRTTIKSMAISPTLERVLCCYRCFALYPPDTEETHCEWREVPGARECGESLWKLRWGGASAPKSVPKRLYTYQTMQSWLEFMLSLPSFEDFIDSSHPEQPRETIHCTDVRDSRMWQEMGDYASRASRSGNLVFAFYIDWFNPFTNKMAGKKFSMGVIILACLNLPPELRYKSEYLFIAGILPGPREPSVVTINNILQPHIDELQRLDTGITIATTKHPEGREIRVRIGPVIADLVALRKVTGFAAHSATMFCSFCELPRTAMASLEPQTWASRSHREVLKASAAWKSARSLARRENLVKKNGVRFSLLHQLSYRDSVKHNVIGIMHNWLEGVLQHLRKRWGLDLSGSIKVKEKDGSIAQKGSPSRVQHRSDNEETSDWESELRDLREEADSHNDEPASRLRLPGHVPGTRLTRPDVDVRYHDIEDSDYHLSSGDVSDNMHAGSQEESASTSSASRTLARDKAQRLSTFDGQTIKDIRTAISDVFLPTWLDRPPTNLGEPSHGKLKADTYFVLFTTILPLHLVEYWTAFPTQTEIAKRALLIGSAVGGLDGVGNDILNMEHFLNNQDFRLRSILNREATQEGIRMALEQVISETNDGDVVLLYYSGHGGLAVAQGEKPEQPWQFQFLVPFDFDFGKTSKFRGISDRELSHYLARLTEKTQNVTVILDCCHSALLARRPGPTPKALQKVYSNGIDAFLETLSQKGICQTFSYLEGNPYSVRLVAAATCEAAYEYTNSQGKRLGVFTDALVSALRRSPRQVPWKSIMAEVKRSVARSFPEQHPQLEGSIDRRIFSLEKVDMEGMLHIIEEDGITRLQGGSIQGVQVDDVYRVMVPDEIDGADNLCIATATVVSVASTWSTVALVFTGSFRIVPVGSQAFLLQRNGSRWPVRLEGDGKTADWIADQLVLSKFLRKYDGSDHHFAPLLVGKCESGAFSLLDSEGVCLSTWPDEVICRPQILQRMERMARARHLLSLNTGVGPTALRDAVEIQWGLVENGEQSELQHQGAELITGQPIFVSVRNEGLTDIYVSLFDVDAIGDITLLSNAASEGRQIPPLKYYRFGSDNNGSLRGQRLRWPSLMPATSVGNEAIVIIVTDNPMDLTCLATTPPGTVIRSQNEKSTSELQYLAQQFSVGTARTLAGEIDKHIRYSVKHIHFRLYSENRRSLQAVPHALRYNMPIHALKRTGSEASPPQGAL